MNLQFDEMTLSNVADGILEELFQERLPEVIEAFSNPGRFGAKEHTISFGLKMGVNFKMSTETGGVTVAVNLAPVPPKPKTYERGATIAGSTILVQRAVQQELFDAKRRRDEPGGDPDAEN